MWIKQRYQECEDLLARSAEPMAAWAHLLRARNGGEADRGVSDQALLRQAWKLLLQNGPHDSICGCSIDQVHDEMRPRFDRCQQVAGEVLRESQRYVADMASRPDELSVVVFNSESGPRTDFCAVRLPLDSGKPPTSVVDEQGVETQLQVLERGLRSPLDGSERVIAGFVATDVPAHGYKTFRVQHGKAQRKAPDASSEVASEFFRVAADPTDGTLTVTDLHDGTVLRHLNRFVDGGDRGDEYNYCPPESDELVATPSKPPRIRVTERGPARWTLEVTQTYSLPAGLSEGRDARSSRRVDCRIVSRVRLYPSVARVDIETEVTNRADDHRLRVLFPSGLPTEHSDAEQHFGVVRRPVALPEASGSWMETPVGTHPQKSFVDLSAGERGLMVANRGLPECEALREADGTVTIALALLRCVGWLSRSDLGTRRGPAGPSLETPDAQMHGTWRFDYSLIPHAGGWETAFREAHAFARPLQAVRTDRGTGELPPAGSLVEVEPTTFVLSSLKTAEDGDGVVVRVYNTSGTPQRGRLRLLSAHAGAELVDLNEEPLGPADVEDGRVVLSARANEILNVKFRIG
jgi:hypothetical protein